MKSTITRLANGNVGALTVLLDLPLHKKIQYDILISIYNEFDRLNFKGHLIWELYKDLCNQDLHLLVTILSNTLKHPLSKDKIIDLPTLDQISAVLHQPYNKELKEKMRDKILRFK